MCGLQLDLEDWEVVEVFPSKVEKVWQRYVPAQVKVEMVRRRFVPAQVKVEVKKMQPEEG